MNVAQAVDHVRTSIVQITFMATHLPDDVRRQVRCPFITVPLGTGFLVNAEGYVITAGHVIAEGHRYIELIQAGRKQIYVGLACPNTENMRGNFILADFTVTNKDARHDLALLKLKRNPFKDEGSSAFVFEGKSGPLPVGRATLNPHRPKDGAAVGISGYPLGEPVLVTCVGWMATSWAFEIAEVPVPGAPERFSMSDIADTYLADVQVNPGNSGGPVYLIENGTVIGVCVATKLAPVRDQEGKTVTIDGRKLFCDSGLATVVPARYVIDLLREHGLNWSDWEN